MRLEDLNWTNIDRNEIIGGTDMGVLLGVNKYKTRKKLIEEKLGHYTVTQNEAMYWGTMHENTIAKHYENKMMSTDHYLLNPVAWHDSPQVQHPNYSFFVGSPDRLVINKEDNEIVRGLEIKNVSEWTRKTWMADAPEMYRIQCQFYMFVCQIDEWDLGACCGGNSYIQHTFGADPFLFDEFIKVGKEFNEELSYLVEKGADEALEKYKKLLTEKDEENDNDIQACIPMGSPEKNSGDTTA